jgi:aminopeptidase-like protein
MARDDKKLSDDHIENLVVDKPIAGSRSTHRYPFPVKANIDLDRAVSLISRFWKHNRSAVNPETDEFALALAAELEAETLEAKSGETCLTWTVPDNWAVRKGQLKTLDGEILVDYADNPLHLWTHSISYSGTISRDDLIKNHINTDPDRPDEFLYHYVNGYRSQVRDWGFSVPYRIVEKMTEDQYQVEIDADLDNEGTLKVVDAFVQGELDETIFIMAHTCHPGQVSDGIGCIATGAELYHQLKNGPKPRYSYRFLFSPEYFGGAVYLEKAGKNKVKNLHMGVYLDMVTTFSPLGFQRSLQGNSRFDYITRNVMKTHTPTPVERPYRKLWGNDETFYNGTGYQIPTLGIGRLMHREYHYDSDNMDNLSTYHLKETAWVLERIIEVLETDYIPEPNFKGPVYLSKYGMSSALGNELPNWRENVERIQFLMDGKHSLMDMATLLDIDFFLLREFVDQFVEKGLVNKIARPVKPEDSGTITSGGIKVE